MLTLGLLNAGVWAMVPSVHPGSLRRSSLDPRWLGGGVASRGLSETAARHALFYRAAPAQPRPRHAHTGEPAFLSHGPALSPPATLARISRNSEPQTFPAGYSLENSQVSPLQMRLHRPYPAWPLPRPFSTEASTVAWAPTLCSPEP